MGVVYYTCPTTNEPVSTGIETDAYGWRCLSAGEAELPCRHCGGVHTWSTLDRWLQEDGESPAPQRSRREPELLEAAASVLVAAARRDTSLVDVSAIVSELKRLFVGAGFSDTDLEVIVQRLASEV
jgi:hypothetical protein